MMGALDRREWLGQGSGLKPLEFDSEEGDV